MALVFCGSITDGDVRTRMGLIVKSGVLPLGKVIVPVCGVVIGADIDGRPCGGVCAFGIVKFFDGAFGICVVF